MQKENPKPAWEFPYFKGENPSLLVEFKKKCYLCPHEKESVTNYISMPAKSPLHGAGRRFQHRHPEP